MRRDPVATRGRFVAFVDESGHTGDVVVASDEDTFSFHGQPYFALAAVGCEEPRVSGLGTIVGELSARYHVQAGELKSSSLYSSRPGLAIELLQHLMVKRCLVMVELTDKKYFLCNQVSNVICAVLLRGSLSDSDLDLLRGCADFLYDRMSTVLFHRFSTACNTRTAQAAYQFLDLLATWLERQPRWPWAALLSQSVALWRQDNPEDAWPEPLFPDPDVGPNGTLLSALPHIASLAGVAARLEHYRRRHELAELVILHDAQRQLWPILSANMAMLQQNDWRGVTAETEIARRAEYHLPTARFEVRDSRTAPAIQAADVIAGTVFRLWRDFIRSGFECPPPYKTFAEHLFTLSELDPSCGVNFVVPQKHFDAFYAQI